MSTSDHTASCFGELGCFDVGYVIVTHMGYIIVTHTGYVIIHTGYVIVIVSYMSHPHVSTCHTPVHVSQATKHKRETAREVEAVGAAVRVQQQQQ